MRRITMAAGEPSKRNSKVSSRESARPSSGIMSVHRPASFAHSAFRTVLIASLTTTFTTLPVTVALIVGGSLSTSKASVSFS